MAKLKHNAYSVFVDDTFRRRRNAGEGNLNKASLFGALGEEWKALTEEQKRKYKDKAKYYNDNPLAPRKPQEPEENPTASNSQTIPNSSSNVNIKQEMKPKPEEVDCRALVPVKRPHEDDPYSVVEHVEKKLKPGLPNYKNLKGSDKIVEPWTIYSDAGLLNLLNSCSNLVEGRYSKMDTVPLYSISTNVLCKERRKVIDKSDQKQSENASKINPLEDKFEEFFTPLEISIYAYTLKDGKLGQPYWALINAGPPVKPITNALEHKKKHKITFSPMGGEYSSCSRADYKKIYQEILNYTKDGERILLVSNAKDIPQVKGSLEWLYKKAKEIILSESSESCRLPPPRVWTILPVVEYVSAMHNLLYKKLERPMPRFGYPYYVRLKLEDTLYDYNLSLMCWYHKQDDKESIYCAQVCALKTFENLSGLFEEIYKIYTTINEIDSTDARVIEKTAMEKDVLDLVPTQNQKQITM